MTISSEDFEAILKTGYLDITFKCPDCKGSGNESYVRYHCDTCQAQWQTPEQSAALNEHLNAERIKVGGYAPVILPCGHDDKHLISDVWGCCECEASGIRVARLTMPELAQVVAAAILQQPSVLNTLRHA